MVGNRLHGWLAALPDMGRGGAAYYNAAALLHRSVRYGMVAKGSVASDLPNARLAAGVIYYSEI